jgi:DNA-3-methyladenine glycosylase
LADKGRRAAPLPRTFYDRDPLEVAPELLGKILLRVARASAGGLLAPTVPVAPGGTLSSPAPSVRTGRIVEVEAYRGVDDAASHAFRGRTPRCATMFGPAGHLYVYFTYGMHHCANVVCWPEGMAGAVLLRAVEPLEGIAEMRDARLGAASAARAADDLCSGPGRLCQALGLDRSHDGADLVHGEQGISIVEVDSSADLPAVSSGPRVGLGERVGAVARSQPWRYWIDGHRSVSRPRQGGVRYSWPPVEGRARRGLTGSGTC